MPPPMPPPPSIAVRSKDSGSGLNSAMSTSSSRRRSSASHDCARCRTASSIGDEISTAVARAWQRQRRAEKEECKPSGLFDDPARRCVDQRARYRGEARKERKLRRGVAWIGRPRNERGERRRAEAYTQRLEGDHDRQQNAIGFVHIGKPREPEDRYDLYHAEEPKPAIDADLEHPEAAEQAANHARPQSRVLGDEPDRGQGKPHVEVERRRERGRHRVAEFVEEDERDDEQCL